MDWPCVADIKNAQMDSNPKPEKRFKPTDRCWKDVSDVKWNPSENKPLKLRTMVAAHAGSGGHRVWRATETVIAAHFF